MNDPSTVIFVEKHSDAKIICGIINTSTLKKSRTNVPSAEKDFVNPEHYKFTKFFTWMILLIDAPLVAKALIKGPI